MTSSNGNIFRVIGLCAGNSLFTSEFPVQRPVMWSFDVFFDMRPNKVLSKQSWGWWFETPSCSLWRDWRHCNGNDVIDVIVMYSEITPLELLPHLPGANELMTWTPQTVYCSQEANHVVVSQNTQRIIGMSLPAIAIQYTWRDERTTNCLQNTHDMNSSLSLWLSLLIGLGDAFWYQ